MGISKRGERFRAQGRGLNGRRVSATFNTLAEAQAFLLKTRQSRAECKVSRRNNSGSIDLDFEIAATRTGTVASASADATVELHRHQPMQRHHCIGINRCTGTVA